MDDRAVIDWFVGASPLQFVLGVLVLVFGTQKILSADNVEKSLGGLLIPVKWLHKKRQAAAEREVSVVARLQKENLRLQKELERYHAWSIIATRKHRDMEAVLAANGLEIPPPPFVYLHAFKMDCDSDEEEDEVEDDV